MEAMEALEALEVVKLCAGRIYAEAGVVCAKVDHGYRDCQCQP